MCKCAIKYDAYYTLYHSLPPGQSESTLQFETSDFCKHKTGSTGPGAAPQPPIVWFCCKMRLFVISIDS